MLQRFSRSVPARRAEAQTIRGTRPRMPRKIYINRRGGKYGKMRFTKNPYKAPKLFKITVPLDSINVQTWHVSSNAQAFADSGGLRITVPQAGMAQYGTQTDTSYIAGGVVHAMNDLSALTNLTALFDKMQIRGVRFELIMNNNVSTSQSTSNGVCAPTVTMLDYVDTSDAYIPAATDTEWVAALGWQGKRVTSAVTTQRKITRYYTPAVLLQTYDGSMGGVPVHPLRRAWVDNTAGSVTMPGIRILLQIVNRAGGTNAQFNYQMMFTYYVGFQDFTNNI